MYGFGGYLEMIRFWPTLPNFGSLAAENKNGWN